MKKWFLLAFLTLIMFMVGCSGSQANEMRARSPSYDTPNTEGKSPVSSASPGDGVPACAESQGRLEVFGAGLGSPSHNLIVQLGQPESQSRSARYGTLVYNYSFGLITVKEADGTVMVVELWAPPPQQELWPGVRFGMSRESVRTALAHQGLCPANPSAEDMAVIRDDVVLTISFHDGTLHRVRLAYVGEP